MSSTREAIANALNNYKDGMASFKKANDALAHGPASYHHERVLEYIDVLFDRLAPFKIGDEVRLIKPPTSGRYAEYFSDTLCSGAEGLVTDVDYYKGKFQLTVKFHKQYWHDADGNQHLTDPDSLAHFFMSEDKVELVNSPPGDKS